MFGQAEAVLMRIFLQFFSVRAVRRRICKPRGWVRVLLFPVPCSGALC